jgi:SAM-dependent methyltransferase
LFLWSATDAPRRPNDGPKKSLAVVWPGVLPAAILSSDQPEYRGLVSYTYDLFGGDTDEEELEFYRRRIQESGEPVLEVGCGTGRLLIQLLADGIDIDGIDNSPEMLGKCVDNAEKRSVSVHGRLQEQQMQRLASARRYRTVLVPASTFQLLTDLEDQRTALVAFRDALMPGGQLVVHHVDLWPGERGAARNAEWRLRCEGPGDDGALYRVFGRTTYDPAARLDRDEERFEKFIDGVTVAIEEHESLMHWFEPEELESLAREVGLISVGTLSGFTDVRLSELSSRQMHLVAARP